MNQEEAQTRMKELEQQIAELPVGSITRKTVNGKIYFYQRWSENGKRREKYIPLDEVDAFREQIEHRKTLEQEIKALRRGLPKVKKAELLNFITNVRTGNTLRTFADAVSCYQKRECFQQLHDYVYGETRDKVFILYGLRRTGKTTMIRQIFAGMAEDELAKAAFIQITAKDTLADVNKDLKTLEQKGFRYDRCVMLHTTFIPYREFESVLGIRGIDEYIRYGGTMSLGGVHYNETSTFASKESADEYVDTAIARNIQHSLRCYQYEGHFRHLHDLYEKDELTSAINRVVEDINHRFTLEVLTRDFKSHDLGISANNLRRDRQNPTDILDRVDMDTVTENLRKLLEIRNQAEQTVKLDRTHVREIREYLELLDLTQEIDVLHLPDVNEKGSRIVIAQPGLRYAQAGALIHSLLLDETFSALSLAERNAVQERVLNEIKGRMMEDIVLLETKLANPKKQVFVLQFPVGEFDMVVFDPGAGCCQIYEIKHSAEAVPQQIRHLIDEKKCEQTKHRYGPITGKYVLYRGKEQVVQDVQYRNVETYLKEIKDKK